MTKMTKDEKILCYRILNCRPGGELPRSIAPVDIRAFSQLLQAGCHRRCGYRPRSAGLRATRRLGASPSQLEATPDDNCENAPEAGISPAGFSKADTLHQNMAIFEIFYQPGTLFASLEKRRAVWVVPLILSVLLTLGTTVAAIRLIGMETITRQRLQSFRLSPEQMQAALERANSPAQLYITYVGAVVGAVVVLLAIAGLLTLFALVGSKQPKYSTNFSMVTLAYFPYTLVVCLMTVLVLMTAPDRGVLDINNLLATNIGAFMNKDTMSSGLYTLLSSIDILSFAEIGLLSYGFAKVNRSSVSFGLFSVMSLWAVYVLIRMGISALF
jgi:hypothetical protein